MIRTHATLSTQAALKFFAGLACILSCQLYTNLHAQKVGIGLTNPVKLLSVNGSILLDQNNNSNGILDSAALLFGTQANVGIASKKTLGGLRNGLQIYTNGISRINISATGMVGIGIATPTSQLHVGGDILSTADIRAMGVGRFDERLAIGGAGLAGYKLYVQGGHSYFQGNGTFSGNLSVTNGIASVKTLNVIESASINQDMWLGNNLNVANDGIIDGNFRVNGRIGINGATNSNYGLIVNNANTYLQGNTTISGNATIAGTTNLQGQVTIQGKGNVRSDGPSSLRIGFSSYYTNMVYDGKEEKAITVNIADFDGGTGNVRVAVAQFEPGSGYEGDVRDFSWFVYNVDHSTNTCKIRLINHSAFIRVLKGTFYLMAIAKD